MTGPLLWIAVGGSAGALARFVVAAAVTERLGILFPYGTFLINVTGCFLLGVLAGGIEAQVIPAGARPALAIGFLGAYTTFSTFGLETLALLEEGSVLLAVVYVSASVLLGVAAVALGLWMGRALG
jgi:fluoride exporter